jgi:hypothetical protein
LYLTETNALVNQIASLTKIIKVLSTEEQANAEVVVSTTTSTMLFKLYDFYLFVIFFVVEIIEITDTKRLTDRISEG